jgi:hypothetical protein
MNEIRGCAPPLWMFKVTIRMSPCPRQQMKLITATTAVLQNEHASQNPLSEQTRRMSVETYNV